LEPLIGSSASTWDEARMHAPEGYLNRKVKILSLRIRSLLWSHFPFRGDRHHVDSMGDRDDSAIRRYQQ
jgi:hypothetical protein